MFQNSNALFGYVQKFYIVRQIFLGPHRKENVIAATEKAKEKGIYLIRDKFDTINKRQAAHFSYKSSAEIQLLFDILNICSIAYTDVGDEFNTHVALREVYKVSTPILSQSYPSSQQSIYHNATYEERIQITSLQQQMLTKPRLFGLGQSRLEQIEDNYNITWKIDGLFIVISGKRREVIDACEVLRTYLI